MSDVRLQQLRDEAIDATVAAGRDDLLVKVIESMLDDARYLVAGCGCRPHAIQPGCLRHDPQGRLAA